MPATPARAEVRGSHREPLHGAQSVGRVPDDERFEVTVRVRRKAPLQAAPAFAAATAAGPRRFLSREDYEEQHGADEADMAKVEAFAKEHKLVVVGGDAARRSVFLSGTARDFAAAFGTRLEQYAHEGGTYRGRTGALTVPADLADIVEGVFGLDDRPVAKPHFQRYQAPPQRGVQAHAAAHSYAPTDLARLYDFPKADGHGQCIAIIELGGGYRPADLKTYFTRLGLLAPHVTAVRVDGGHNQPSTPDSADGEVMLDIEVAAGVAPKAHIAVYFAPNTDKGFLDAITMAVHDKVNKPSVISISWGSAEMNWTPQALKSYDQAFQAAAALGVTVCAAAGDNGSADGVSDGNAHVDFPASSPFVLACGGTRVIGSGTTVSSETVWNDGPNSATGGGFSGFFPTPKYQDGVISALGSSVGKLPPKPGRGVPDVAGDADPVTGYAVRVDGEDMVIGGTSAVAPLWAGLVALMNQKKTHPVGYLNPLLYAAPVMGSGGIRDVGTGNNGAWHARTGWDPCTGWGSPDGNRLLAAL
jgi:kumamolisin